MENDFQSQGLSGGYPDVLSRTGTQSSCNSAYPAYVGVTATWISLSFFVTKAKSKGKKKVKTGPTNLTEIMENKNKAPFMHSVAKPPCFQKDYGCCEKALKSKTTMRFWAMKAQQSVSSFKRMYV